MHKIVIGIDQSYKRTGITKMVDGEPVRMEYVSGEEISHATFRRILRRKLIEQITTTKDQYKLCDIMIIVERIRLRSRGKKEDEKQDDVFLSLNYIQTTGALVASIIEAAELNNVPVYSVDTRAWKSAIVGTSKPMENKYGLPPEKYPTILYVKKKGLLREIVEPYEGRAKKGIVTIREGGHKYRARVLDDVADSYCIAEYGFLPEEKQKLKREDF